jgi:hypothetical protein
MLFESGVFRLRSGLQLHPVNGKATATAKYRDLSATTAMCAAFGRDDVVCGGETMSRDSLFAEKAEPFRLGLCASLHV